MNTPRTPRREAGATHGRPDTTKRTRRPGWIVGLVVIVGVMAIVGIISLALQPRSRTATGSSGLPEPIGGPAVAQDVNTLIGKPAPAFTLPDSDGKRYTVTPGQGRPLVLISHMGIT